MSIRSNQAKVNWIKHESGMFPGSLGLFRRRLSSAPAAVMGASAVLVITMASGHLPHSDALVRMDQAIERSILDQQIPGGVLWVESKAGQYHRAYGQRCLVPIAEAMTEDTIFDVASLTKVMATVPALMVLYDRGLVHLDKPVQTYLPEFIGGNKELVTLRHLLTHTSGLRRSLRREPDWYDFNKAFADLCASKLAANPGEGFIYSDLNFILLGEIIQRRSGLRLDAFCSEAIFKPLKMFDTGFLPSTAANKRIAPTEVVGPDVLRGSVHDSKAQAMGGVAGHAGLFTSASDTARFARMMLNGGTLEGIRILQPGTIQLMTSVQTPANLSVRRGLGWDIDSNYSQPRGELFQIGSYGHTGFTGVCLWIDPGSNAFWLFFSNRIHPSPTTGLQSLQQSLGTLAAQAVQSDISVPTPIPENPSCIQ